MTPADKLAAVVAQAEELAQTEDAWREVWLPRIKACVAELQREQGRLTDEQEQAALANFIEYFVANYPGPKTIITDPKWHAPKIFKAAKRALLSAPTPEEDSNGNS